MFVFSGPVFFGGNVRIPASIDILSDKCIYCKDLDKGPCSYLAWHSWAEAKIGYTQYRCPMCLRWTIWIKDEIKMYLMTKSEQEKDEVKEIICEKCWDSYPSFLGYTIEPAASDLVCSACGNKENGPHPSQE